MRKALQSCHCWNRSQVKRKIVPVTWPLSESVPSSGRVNVHQVSPYALLKYSVATGRRCCIGRITARWLERSSWQLVPWMREERLQMSAANAHSDLCIVSTHYQLFITSSARCSAAAIALLSCISLSILHRRNAIEFLDKVLDPWRLSSKSLGLWPLPLLGPSEDAVLGSDQCSQPRMVVFVSPRKPGTLILIHSTGTHLTHKNKGIITFGHARFDRCPYHDQL